MWLVFMGYVRRIALFAFICLFGLTLTSVSAQESAPQPSVESKPSPCETHIQPVDRNEFADDAGQAAARAMAMLLNNAHECLGHIEEGIGFNQDGNGVPGQGVASKSDSSNQSSATATGNQHLTNLSNTPNSSTTAIANQPSVLPTSQPQQKTSTLMKVTKSLNSAMNALNPTNTPLGSADDLVIDDYSKTLYEAYLAENDPVLKEALGKELQNYSNQNN